MLMHETFVRCPKCSHPYFRKNTYVLLNKDAFEWDIIQEDTQRIEYVCSSCGALLETSDKERGE